MSESLPPEVNPIDRTRSSESAGTQSSRYEYDSEFEETVRNYREPESESTSAGNNKELESFSDDAFEPEVVTTQPSTSDPLVTSSGTTLGKRASSTLSGSSSSTRPYKAWKASDPSPSYSPSHSIETEVAPIVVTPPEFTHLPTIPKLPYGVQWELARLASALSKRTADDLKKLDSILAGLHGKPNTVVAPKIPRLFRNLESGTLSNWDQDKEDELTEKYAKLESESKSPWRELDTEENILRENPFGGLGCNEDDPRIMDAGADSPHWHGGKVNFAATLVDNKKKLSINLEKPYLSSSCRLYRRFGSFWFIRVSIHKNLVFNSGSSVIKFFQSPVVIWHHVYRAFYHKDHTVFLVRTNEQYQNGRIAILNESSCNNPSFLDFLSWHNDPEVNYNQPMPKWASRLALGLSNSVPVMRIQPQNYCLIEEVYSPMHDPIKDGKAPSILEMTDGCGLANAAFFKVIQQRLGLDHPPTAVQCRLQGMKGLFLLHPDHINSAVGEPIVWVRPSQQKIKFHHDVLVNPDPALFTVDLLRTSHMSSPARLSSETIINMAENGVSWKTFAKLMREQLWESVQKLIFWSPESNDGVIRKPEDTLRLLRANVEKDGSVPRVLLARQNPGTARVHGFVADDPRGREKNQEVELDDEDDMGELESALHEQSMAWWADPLSGCPSALHETVITLLDAGFSPKENAYLQHKLRQVVEMSISKHTNKFHFDVLHSCTAFVVPDPCFVLEPGEVHIKSSHHNLHNQQGNLTDIILGEVLLTRHPCKLPTDVQKATAVFKKELMMYTDIIIVSVKGHKVGDEILGRHLASMTGGGDYDGDKMLAFWDPELVQQFKPADPKYATEPAGVQEALSKENITVPAVLDTMKPEHGYLHQIQVMQKHLLGGLDNASLVGNYSKLWEHATYQYGYSHVLTSYLAHMFCLILDGSKTGVTVNLAHYQKDKDRFQSSKTLLWKESGQSGIPHVTRGRGLHRFVMDDLNEQRQNEIDSAYKKLDKVFTLAKKAAVSPKDPDLARCWEMALENTKAQSGNAESPSKDRIIARERLNDLKLIKSEIEKLCTTYRTKVNSAFSKLPIEVRQDILRGLSKEFASIPSAGKLQTFTPASHDLELIKASCAYVSEYERRHGGLSQIPYSVAMKHLCYMKATATGLSKTVCAWMEPALHTHKAWVPGNGKV